MKNLRWISVVGKTQIVRLGRMEHILEFDDAVGVGGVERGVFGDVPSLGLELARILRGVGEKKLGRH